MTSIPHSYNLTEHPVRSDLWQLYYSAQMSEFIRVIVSQSKRRRNGKEQNIKQGIQQHPKEITEWSLWKVEETNGKRQVNNRMSDQAFANIQQKGLLKPLKNYLRESSINPGYWAEYLPLRWVFSDQFPQQEFLYHGINNSDLWLSLRIGVEVREGMPDSLENGLPASFSHGCSVFSP